MLGDQTGAMVSAHGSRAGNGVSMIDGFRIGNMYISSNLTNMSLSPLLFDQVDVQLSGQMAETGSNGDIMNAIPKAGGNSFSGTLLANGSGPSLQGNNVTDGLQARGLHGASTTLKKLYDINGAIGGPIKQDRAWFYFTSRILRKRSFLAGRFYSTDVTAVQRVNDPAQQGFAGTYTYDNNGRVTVADLREAEDLGWYAYQYKVDPHWLLAALQPVPRSQSRITTWHTQLSTSEVDLHGDGIDCCSRPVSWAGESPDTILLESGEQVWGTCPVQGSLSAPVHRGSSIRPRGSPIGRRRDSTSTSVCRARRSMPRGRVTSPDRAQRQGQEPRYSAATSGAVTTTTRRAASGPRSTSVRRRRNRRARPCLLERSCRAFVNTQCTGHGVAGQPELQPRDFRAGPVDAWTA